MTKVTRREVLVRGAAGAGALLVLPEAAKASLGRAMRSAQQRKTMVVALAADVVSWDPHISQTTYFRMIQTAIWDALFRLNPATLRAEPSLAESVVERSNGTYDITIKRGVVFHSGDPLRAADVKYSLDRVLNPATGSPLRASISAIKRVQVLGPYRVRIVLSDVTPGLFVLLAKVRILSRATDSTIRTQPNGTGPYRFGEWNPNSNVLLRPFTRYRVKGQPRASALNYLVIPDRSAQAAALQTGSVHAAILSPLTDAQRLNAISGVTLRPPRVLDIGDVMYFNQRRQALADPRVRQAIAYAFDKQVYIRNFLAGRGIVNITPHAPASWAYNAAQARRYPTDLTRARTLLNQAGYGPGQRGLELDFIFPAGFPEWRSAAQMLQAQLDPLDVDVRVQELQAAVWVARMTAQHDFDLAFNNVGGATLDPSVPYANAFLYTPGDSGVPGWNDSEATNLMRRAKLGRQPVRKQRYLELQTRWNDQMHSLIVGQKQFVHAVRTSVRGWVTDPTFEQAWERVEVV